MRYHEIAAASDRRQPGNIVKSRNQTSVKQIGPAFVEAPINRLYNDLMDALEGRMMNVESDRRRREH
jgi:hypothetical protein